VSHGRDPDPGWTINGTNIVFDHNVITDTARATVDREPPSKSSAARHVVVSNNVVGRGRLYFLASVGAPASIDDVSILDNHFVGRAMTIHVFAPLAAPRTHYRVIGNVSDTAADLGAGGVFQFRNVRGLEVRGNTQPVARNHGTHGVAIKNVSDVVVSGNRFLNAAASLDDNGGNAAVSQSGNWIGNPLTAEPASSIS
jgi:hypothetical protein